jgi:hypothetical protein
VAPIASNVAVPGVIVSVVATDGSSPLEQPTTAMQTSTLSAARETFREAN